MTRPVTRTTKAVSIFTSMLESFAVGDAMGMPTEFMTRKEIAGEFGAISTLIPTERSAHHSELSTGSVTDDTEQTLYLLRKYCQDKEVTVEGTVDALLCWIRETDAVSKRYIGPSSLKALQSIESGTPVETAGTGGTTCGGIMRTLAPVLCCHAAGAAEPELLRSVRACLLPTHNTSLALEAAGAYGYAVTAALQGNSINDILYAAYQGADKARSLAPYTSCGASSSARIRFLASYVPQVSSSDELLDFLFNVFGTGLESADVCSAVFGLFLYAKEDVWLAIRLAAEVGGDTDTIAALVGALCTAYAGSHNIPAEIVDTVRTVNQLDVSAVAVLIQEAFSNHEA